jgi:iron donor protein CyaY
MEFASREPKVAMSNLEFLLPAELPRGLGLSSPPMARLPLSSLITLRLRGTLSAMDEQEFQKRCDAAFEALRRRLQEAGDAHGFEVEGGSGKLELLFEDEEETRFVISPNTPVRQIWISALTTSFKLSWSDAAGTFVLDKTGETLMQLMGRILTEQLGSPVTV